MLQLDINFVYTFLGITLTSHAGRSQSFAEVKVIKEDSPASKEGTLQLGQSFKDFLIL